MNLMKLAEVKLVDIPTVRGSGCVSFLQKDGPLPFEPQRMYFLHDVPQDAARGAHAHKALQQFIWAIAGSFHLVLDDGYSRQEFFMDSLTKGVYLPCGLWRELYGFSEGAVCAVLASEKYDEADYIRDYEEFKAYVTGSQKECA